MRALFPELLGDWAWHWPGRGLSPDGEQVQDADDPDAILDLTPCQFGWPASRGRSYSVSLLNLFAVSRGRFVLAKHNDTNTHTHRV